jgi:three-Cys-motif partner protein
MNSFREKNKWKLVYFDGFAGSGSRNEGMKETSSDLLQELFRDYCLDEQELETYKGAAERVLSISQRGFDFYYFVDKDKESSLKLHELLAPFENDKTLVYRNSDANKQIEMLANAMHNDNGLAALVLLDPFGMQVDWKSIELLKGTRTDLWILIPTGVIVNRLLDRRCELTHAEKLTTFFGKDENFLKDYFYTKKRIDTLFGETEVIEKVKKPIEKIAELYIE